MQGLNFFQFTKPEQIDRALLEVKAHDLMGIYKKPTLFFLPGINPQAVFISVLLHGNEPSGFYAMQKILQECHAGQWLLQRSVYFFLGNLAASAKNLRKLPTGKDYNRIWSQQTTGFEGELTEYLVQRMQDEKIAAAIDIHNNTGQNPHYACIVQLTSENLHLAKIFSPRGIHICLPLGAHAIRFAEFTAAITLECGLPSDPKAIDHSYQFLKKCLSHQNLSDIPVSDQPLKLYENEARIVVPGGASIAFADQANTDFVFRADIEQFNFVQLDRDVCIGVRKNPQLFLTIESTHQQGVGDRFIYYQDERIYIRAGEIPSMFTTLVQNVHDDCLCYLMRLRDDSGEMVNSF